MPSKVEIIDTNNMKVHQCFTQWFNPPSRKMHVGVQTNNKIQYHGGIGANDEVLNDTWLQSFSGKYDAKWKKLKLTTSNLEIELGLAGHSAVKIPSNPMLKPSKSHTAVFFGGFDCERYFFKLFIFSIKK